MCKCVNVIKNNLDLLYHNVIYCFMLKLKTKWFHKWAKKHSIADNILLLALEAISKNFNVVNLGGGVF